MKTNLTNFDIETAINTLSTLNETGILGYAIAKNLRILRTESTEYRDACMKWIQEHGNQKESGVYVYNRDKMLKDLKDIAEIEQEVDVYQVDVATFTSGNLTSKQMDALMEISMVKEEGNGG